MNYPWSRGGRGFAADFGGVARWQVPGVAGARAEIGSELAAMRAAGVDVVRWWMFPSLRGDGVALDDHGGVTMAGSTREDIAAALELAHEHDVRLQLCLFSFDNFRPTAALGGGVVHHGLAPLLQARSTRARLIEALVADVAALVEAHPHADRVVAWELCNEPEWATSGGSPLGDPDFTPMTGVQPIPFATMELFLAEAAAALKALSPAPVTVGGAAMKWAQAWTRLPLDFLSFHSYEWVHRDFPFDRPFAKYGLPDLPIVMGEFPITGLAGLTHDRLVQRFFELGYAGALAWAYADPKFPWHACRHDVRAFADRHGSRVRF